MAKAKAKPVTTEKLVEDLHTVVRDAEELLKVTHLAYSRPLCRFMCGAGSASGVIRG